jgi:hypothetical protein
MSWIHNGEPYELGDLTHKDVYGFVYVVTNKATGKKYIGKKVFWAKKTRQVKGKKKKYLGESDWKSYYGSCELLNEERANGSLFDREILVLCKSKGECNYIEMQMQMSLDVILKPDEYYNRFVGGKIHANHVNYYQYED